MEWLINTLISTQVTSRKVRKENNSKPPKISRAVKRSVSDLQEPLAQSKSKRTAFGDITNVSNIILLSEHLYNVLFIKIESTRSKYPGKKLKVGVFETDFKQVPFVFPQTCTYSES